MAQMINPEAGGHSGSVLVGRIDSIESDGERVMGRGVIDTATDYGSQVVELLESQTLRFVSIDIGAAQYEQDESEDAVAEMVFTNYEVMGATIVPFPALPGAVIWLDNMEEPPEMTRFKPLEQVRKLFTKATKELAFSPDQERDESGRWSSGGGTDTKDREPDKSDLVPGADLTGAYLHNRDLSEIGLTGANLTGAKMEGARTNGADMLGATMPDGTKAFSSNSPPNRLRDRGGRLDFTAPAKKN